MNTGALFVFCSSSLPGCCQIYSQRSIYAC